MQKPVLQTLRPYMEWVCNVCGHRVKLLPVDQLEGVNSFDDLKGKREFDALRGKNQ